MEWRSGWMLWRTAALLKWSMWLILLRILGEKALQWGGRMVMRLGTEATNAARTMRLGQLGGFNRSGGRSLVEATRPAGTAAGHRADLVSLQATSGRHPALLAQHLCGPGSRNLSFLSGTGT